MTELVAGRELDALVAEKVMGWTGGVVRAEDFGVRESNADNTPNIQLAINVATSLGDTVPHYSTDIAAAWQVLDEMVWRVGTADIRLDMEDYGRGAGTSATGPDRAVWVTIGEHTAFGPAPLAICRAALAALEE